VWLQAFSKLPPRSTPLRHNWKERGAIPAYSELTSLGVGSAAVWSNHCLNKARLRPSTSLLLPPIWPGRELRTWLTGFVKYLPYLLVIRTDNLPYLPVIRTENLPNLLVIRTDNLPNLPVIRTENLPNLPVIRTGNLPYLPVIRTDNLPNLPVIRTENFPN